MTDGTVAEELSDSGPIDYLVVEFPGNRMTGEAFPLLLDLVDRGLIRIIDFVFVRRETDGRFARRDSTCRNSWCESKGFETIASQWSLSARSRSNGSNVPASSTTGISAVAGFLLTSSQIS